MNRSGFDSPGGSIPPAHRVGWTTPIEALACRTPATVLRLKPDPYLARTAAELGVVAIAGVINGPNGNEPVV